MVHSASCNMLWDASCKALHTLQADSCQAWLTPRARSLHPLTANLGSILQKGSDREHPVSGRP
jgi:hypothetical protein